MPPRRRPPHRARFRCAGAAPLLTRISPDPTSPPSSGARAAQPLERSTRTTFRVMTRMLTQMLTRARARRRDEAARVPLLPASGAVDRSRPGAASESDETDYASEAVPLRFSAACFCWAASESEAARRAYAPPPCVPAPAGCVWITAYRESFSESSTDGGDGAITAYRESLSKSRAAASDLDMLRVGTWGDWVFLDPSYDPTIEQQEASRWLPSY